MKQEMTSTSTLNSPINRIYTLVDPRTNQVRYVGITKHALSRRLHDHIRQAISGFHSHKCSWIRQLLADNRRPEIVLLESTQDRLRECFWIAHYRGQGSDLTNATDGGDGLVNPSEEVRRKISSSLTGKSLSADTREKIRLAGLGRKHTPESIAYMKQIHTGKKMNSVAMEKVRTVNTGRKHGPEARANMSRGQKQRLPFSEDHLRNMSIANKGKTLSEETRNKISAAQTGRKLPPEWKMNISESLRGKPKSKEHVEKVRQALKGQVISPEAKAKMSASHKGKPLSEIHKRNLRLALKESWRKRKEG